MINVDFLYFSLFIIEKCPFCWEEIKKYAKKCRYCWEQLPELESNSKAFSNRTALMQLENKLLMISSVILGIAIIWFGWYWFYLFTRVTIFIIMIALFIKNYKYKIEIDQKLRLYWISWFIYNPIFSIYLSRGVWTVIDIILIVSFLQIVKRNNLLLKSN